MKSAATVYLVGAGPGDPGLLTLRGAELLRRADVIVHDALVNPELLRLAPKTAEIIYAGKRPREHAMCQEDLNRLLVRKARQGKCVVRLKGGDPYIFGRGGEEAEELAKAKVPFEVVPGISSVVAGPSYAGIPLTHRDHASSFTVVTGHEDPVKEENQLDLKHLAADPGTKIILMGVERIRSLAELLMKEGLPGTTPVGMVRWGTTARQQTIEGTLATIADLVEVARFEAPAVAIIGDVVKLRMRLNWFEHRPLFGQRIVVTRARDQAQQLSDPLRELGAEILEIPTIKTAPPDDKESLRDALLGLNAYDWIVFTSPNGVSCFFDYFFKAFDDLRDIGGVRIAAVGPATAAKLKEIHLKVDLMPKEALGRNVTEALAGYQSIENVSILLLRAQEANPDLPQTLMEKGAIVDDVAVYKTVPETEEPSEAEAQLLQTGADWITFTSGSTVENFHARFDLPSLLQRFPKTQLASIGPETSTAIARLGLTPAVEPRQHTIPDLVQALEKHVRLRLSGRSRQMP